MPENTFAMPDRQSSMSMSTSLSRPVPDARLFLVVVIVVLGLYALRMAVMAHLVQGGVGLHVDEAQYWDWSRDLAWGYYSKPPVIAALIAASTALFGDGVLAIKALAMLCYPVTSVVLYLLGRDMGGPRVGAIAALLFAVTPLAGLLGLAATTDAPLLLAWTLALWCLWRAWHAPSALSWIALGLACGGGLLSKYTAAAFAFTVAGFLWSERHDRAMLVPRLRGLVLVALVALAVFAPNLVWNAAHGWPTLRHTAEITASARSPWALRALASFTEFTLAQALVVGPLVVVWALALALARKPKASTKSSPSAAPPALAYAQAKRLAVWSAVPLLLLGALQAAHAHAEVNWAAPAAPGLLLLLALVAAHRPKAWGWLWACVLVHLGLTLAVLLAGDVARLAGRPLPASLDVWARMRGWQEAFDSLAPELRSRPGVMVVGTSRAALAQGAYAWRTQPIHWSAWSEDGRVMNHYQLTHPLSLEAGRTQGPVLVLGESEPPPGLGAQLGAMHPLAVATVSASRRVRLHLWEAGSEANREHAR